MKVADFQHSIMGS